MQWQRSYQGAQYDFTLYKDGEPIARIYRHQDKKRWQWFWQVMPGESGVCNSKDEAVKQITNRAQ
jgi:hypothetical protein